MVHQEGKVKIIKIGSRGVAFSFYEDFMGDTTFSYLINAKRHVYLFDTFCGPDSMEHIKKYMKETKINSKPLIIIITHNHWDHFWGNCAFSENLIISHSLCRKGMEETAKADLERMKKWAQGKVEIILPNLVFDENIAFPEDSIDIFHTPGHTQDHLSAYDNIDKVLVVGDNVEFPVPYINDTDTNSYIKTLNRYKDTDWNHLIIGHGEIQTTRELLQSNLRYVQNFIDLKNSWKYFDEEKKKNHFINLACVGQKLYEENKPMQAKEMLNEVLKIGTELSGEFFIKKIEETKIMLEKLN